MPILTLLVHLLAVALGGQLIPGAAMGTARAAHTATVLLDGRVLLAGGMTASEREPAGAELFDPATGRYAPAGAMRIPRHSHTATRLADGRVLIAGGYDAEGRYLAGAEVYDPARGTFEPTGAMGTARAGHVAVPLADGRVLLVGGVGEGWTFLASAETYDPTRGTFAATGAMGVPRESHAAARLADGRVLIVGGHTGSRRELHLLAEAERYDPATGRFSPAGRMTMPRHKHDAVTLADGRVLVTGGTDERDSRGIYRSAELYDPAKGVFQPAGTMRLPRYKHRGSAVLLADGRVLIAGGADEPEVYEPGENVFRLIRGPGRLSGLFSAVAPLTGDAVLITGGYGEGRGPQASTWLFRGR